MSPPPTRTHTSQAIHTHDRNRANSRSFSTSQWPCPCSPSFSNSTSGPRAQSSLTARRWVSLSLRWSASAARDMTSYPLLYSSSLLCSFASPRPIALVLAALTPALFTGCVVLYLSIHIQSLRTFLPDAKSTWTILPQPPPLETPPTSAEKVEAVRVLAAGNALVGLLLMGAIGMQIGQEYAHNLEVKEQRAIDEAARKAEAEDKKNI